MKIAFVFSIVFFNSLVFSSEIVFKQHDVNSLSFDDGVVESFWEYSDAKTIFEGYDEDGALSLRVETLFEYYNEGIVFHSKVFDNSYIGGNAHRDLLCISFDQLHISEISSLQRPFTPTTIEITIGFFTDRIDEYSQITYIDSFSLYLIERSNVPLTTFVSDSTIAFECFKNQNTYSCEFFIPWKIFTICPQIQHVNTSSSYPKSFSIGYFDNDYKVVNLEDSVIVDTIYSFLESTPFFNSPGPNGYLECWLPISYENLSSVIPVQTIVNTRKSYLPENIYLINGRLFLNNLHKRNSHSGFNVLLNQCDFRK
jgi:hypothetical protein